MKFSITQSPSPRGSMKSVTAPRKIKKKQKHSISKEIIVHFRCGVCDKWWSVGDAPQAKKEWWCPWCGEQSKSIR